ncbi:MAG: 7,8-didemethyl-8-hydroxy-5-deazariboflavin synthase subunit CofG [Halobacteriota archaeon]|nr:7,8-didemethyl-8-hydroxy-5-deazariboflavin synthase subunit CofG [Halobacteriota archaeon]
MKGVGVHEIIRREELPTYNVDYVTFSRNVFIPVTNVCRNACKYCGFRRPINSKEAYLMKREDVRRIFEKNTVATEALFTFGEHPEEVPLFREWLKKTGHSNIIDHLIDLSKMAIESGLLPHTNIGILNYGELKRLKPLNASMGLMLESTANLDVHRDSPGKDPEERIRTIEDAGRLKIPFTTGILLGIGESWDDRIKSLSVIKDLHNKYSHIQEVIIQPFTPKKATTMSSHPPPSFDILKKTVAIARMILPEDVHIQVPPNLISPYELVRHGATDLGGISRQTIDHINPESEWPTEEELRDMLRGIPLKERLPIYPGFIKKRWYGDETVTLIEEYADEEGLRGLDKRTEDEG